MIDRQGFRPGVAIILINERRQVFWARRVGQNAWQFPQGGIMKDETPEEAMYRELREEIGLDPEDVEIVASSSSWLRYRLPKRLIRYYSRPVCVGQRQKWFLLKLVGSVQKIRFDVTDTPEFDQFRWVRYWFPLRRVVAFKRRVYREALKEFASILFKDKKPELMEIQAVQDEQGPLTSES